MEAILGRYIFIVGFVTLFMFCICMVIYRPAPMDEFEKLVRIQSLKNQRNDNREEVVFKIPSGTTQIMVIYGNFHCGGATGDKGGE